jgi:hypothetical protein
METNLFSRRSALAALGLAALAPGCASTASGPALYRKFRAVQIDVKPLAVADPFSAGIIAETTPQWIPRYYGSYLAPGDASAPVLVLRYEQLSFGLPGSANGPYGNGAMDYVQGEGVVIGPGGRTLSSYPLTCSLYTNVDEYDVTGAYSRARIASLGQALAQFMPGKLGL